MPTFDLNLRNFLAHANKASASDTLVMRSDGKTSERGMIRSAFTNIERYRETTRQFIEKFCRLEGNSQYREMANEFFAENLREEEGKPLSARTVKAFLGAVDAKKAQTEARWEKWSAWTLEKPELVDRKIALATQFEREMSLYTESFMANADFQEATQDLLYMLAQVPERNLQDNDLYQYACDVLKNHSLTADQAAKRLNVLLALVNPESAEFEMAGPYGDNECRRCVVMNLLASVDHPNVTGGSSMQILDQVLTLAEKREGLETASFAPGQVPQFSDIQERIDSLAEDFSEKVSDQIVQIICSIPKVAEKMSVNKASTLIAGKLDSLFGYSLTMTMSANVQFERLAFTDMAMAQKTIAWDLFDDLSKTSNKRNVFDQNIPALKGVLDDLDRTAMRAANPNLFEVDLRAGDMHDWTEFSDCLDFVGEITYAINSTKIRTSPMDEQIPEEQVFSSAKLAFTGDLFRHQAIEAIECFNTPKEKREDSFHHVIIQSANGVETISPCDLLAELVERLSKEQHVTPKDVKLGDTLNTLKKEAGERVASSVRAIAQNSRQAAVALIMMAQSNDGLRDTIHGQSGVLYDKGVYADEDGNLHVFRQTRKGCPTHFYMEFVVTPDGKVKMDQDSMILTNDPK